MILACRDDHTARTRRSHELPRSLAQARLIRADSVVLERYTMCGSCQSYRLTLRRGGSSDFVVLLGAVEPTKRFVVADSTLFMLDKQILFGQIRALPDGIVDGAPLCGPYATDGGGVVLRIYAATATKQILDKQGCAWAPAALRDLERAIDSVGDASNAVHVATSADRSRIARVAR